MSDILIIVLVSLFLTWLLSFPSVLFLITHLERYFKYRTLHGCLHEPAATL